MQYGLNISDCKCIPNVYGSWTRSVLLLIIATVVKFEQFIEKTLV